ncbi:MAG: UDP-N-acetylmuramoyl-tripeptide--D-alanyl-D-alanine ligase [Aureispira sp.]|nr:UDP-N-acetylmuramoyl-tripeptide--D-alanyl-D-alanine ligase [Aureispira sp.]
MNIHTLYQAYTKQPEVYIDTRKITEGSIFFALGVLDKKGVHRGNQFAEQAIEEKGAAFAVINDPALKAKHADDHRYFLVKNGEAALQALAKQHRQQLNIPIIGIAGSNGKTTAKELLHNILSKQYKTFSTRGNLNNHLGVPLSLLQIDASYEMAILEIGANHLEETYFLSQIIEPDYGLVTNCGKDHLGEYGSVENIIKANKELYDFLEESEGLAFVNAQDPVLLKASQAVSHLSYYGKETDSYAKITKRPLLGLNLTIQEETIAIQTKLFGAFWLDTIIGVAHIGNHFGISAQQIKKAVEEYHPAALRSQQLQWKNNSVLLDCYNANPSSMEVFLQELQQAPLFNAILILGEMLELGEYSQTEHQELVDSIDYSHFEQVIFVGEEFTRIQLPSHQNSQHINTTKEAIEWVNGQKWAKKSFFVKGSRGNRLEDLFVSE